MGLRLSAWGRRRRRLALQIAAIVVIVSAAAAGLHTLRPLSSINARMSDLLVVAPDTPAAVTIAAIDDATIARYGRLAEWSRGLHATAIENLTNAGARVIAFDVLFADPAPGDDRLRRALGGSTAVLATAFTGTGRVAAGAEADMLEFDGFIAPLASLAGVAELAHANLTPDQDGVVRTVPLIASGPNGIRQVSLAYATLARFFVQSPSTDLPVADGTAHLLAPLPLPLGRFAPIEPGTRLRVSYVGPAGSIPRVSYAEIIENRFDPAAVANRPVLIGLTATGAHDTFPTVFGGAEMPGVEVHANVLDQLLAGRWLVRVPASAVLAGEALTLALIVLALVRRSTRVLLILGPLLGAGWFAAIVIAGTSRVIVEPLYPSIVLGLAWVLALGSQLTAERAERQTVQRLFGRYVSTAVATEVARRVDSGELSLGGERHEITAMFADIRGFTQLSGEVEPEVAMLVVNQVMRVLIRQVDAGGGIVNKFSGDGLWRFGTFLRHTRTM